MARFIDKKLNRIDLTELFAQIKEAREVDAEGNVNFKGDRFFQTEAILSGAIDLNPEIRGISRERVKIQGIRKACKDEDLSESSLIQSVKEAEVEYLGKPKQRFVILGNLTINPALDLTSRYFRKNGVSISFPSYRPPKFQTHPEVETFLGSRSMGNHFGRFFRASVWARTPEDAAVRALTQMDVLRALWNIALTRNQRRYFNYQRQPLNNILMGPTYTAHDPTGALAEKNRYWFEPGYCYNADIFRDPFRKWSGVENYERAFRLKLARLPTEKYRDKVASALIRYVRALDGTIWEDAIFRLWSILESLTGTADGESYDRVVKRTAGIFVDFQYHKQVLENLRHYRNEIVHEDAGSHYGQDNLYLLKSYVEKLIEFHVNDGARLGGFTNLCEFLELPNERNALQNSLASLKQGIRLREILINRLDKLQGTSK